MSIFGPPPMREERARTRAKTPHPTKHPADTDHGCYLSNRYHRASQLGVFCHWDITAVEKKREAKKQAPPISHSFQFLAAGSLGQEQRTPEEGHAHDLNPRGKNDLDPQPWSFRTPHTRKKSSSVYSHPFRSSLSLPLNRNRGYLPSGRRLCDTGARNHLSCVPPPGKSMVV